MSLERRASAKEVVRSAAVAVATVLTAPCWIPARLEQALTGGEGFFAAGSELLSLIPGALGIYLRRGFYRICLDECAIDCHIGFGTTVAHTRAQVGRGVYIGNRCTLGQVVIEDDVTVGSNVDILSGRHQHHFDDLHRPIQEQGGTFTPIRIGRNTWIGNSTVVMADIGSDCVIGAGSVVVKPIVDRSVAAGNPASIKRQREPAASPRSIATSSPAEGAAAAC